MPLVYNGVTVTKVIYNGVDLDKLIYNGVEVFTKYVPPPPPIREPASGDYYTYSAQGYYFEYVPMLNLTKICWGTEVFISTSGNLSFKVIGLYTYYRGTSRSLNKYGIYRIKN